MMQPEHGTYGCYTQCCCRCDLCRDAQAAYNRERRLKNLERPMPEHLHGTQTGYSNWSCRCEPCKEAKRIANRVASAKSRAKWKAHWERAGR